MVELFFLLKIYRVVSANYLKRKIVKKFTAFIVHNMGQFEWSQTSQSFYSALGQYQQLMELTVKGLHQVIDYIDDFLVHNSDHVSHSDSLLSLFDRL